MSIWWLLIPVIASVALFVNYSVKEIAEDLEDDYDC